MTNEKRRPGRPIGTHIRDDKALALVADKMAADPNLKPSTAMWAVCKAGKLAGQSDNAIVARLLRKWRTAGPAALEAARQRRQPSAQQAETFVVQWPEAAAFEAQVREIQAQMAAFKEPLRKAMEQMATAAEPTRKMVEQMQQLNLPSMKAFEDMQAHLAASPSLKVLQRFQEQVRSLPPIPNLAYISDVIRRTR